MPSNAAPTEVIAVLSSNRTHFGLIQSMGGGKYICHVFAEYKVSQGVTVSPGRSYGIYCICLCLPSHSCTVLFTAEGFALAYVFVLIP